MSTKVLLGLFNSQIVQHYISDSVFTDIAYMRTLDSLKVSTNECFSKFAPNYWRKIQNFFIKKLNSGKMDKIGNRS